tara:strand:- start:538 stop:1410 length:873 start_codon:yes stop_codon:yes gene_type:complete
MVNQKGGVLPAAAACMPCTAAAVSSIPSLSTMIGVSAVTSAGVVAAKKMKDKKTKKIKKRKKKEQKGGTRHSQDYEKNQGYFGPIMKKNGKLDVDEICHNCSIAAYERGARRFCKVHGKVWDRKTNSCRKKNNQKGVSKKILTKLQIKNSQRLNKCEKTAKNNKNKKKKCLDEFNKTWEDYSKFLKKNAVRKGPRYADRKQYTPKQQREIMRRFFGKNQKGGYSKMVKSFYINSNGKKFRIIQKDNEVIIYSNKRSSKNRKNMMKKEYSEIFPDLKMASKFYQTIYRVFT